MSGPLGRMDRQNDSTNGPRRSCPLPYQRSREAIEQLFNELEPCFYFTGTYRQARIHEHDAGPGALEYLDFEKANRNITIFRTAASRALFGCSQEKRGKRIFTYGYIEGHPRAGTLGRQRIHCHLIIGGPFERTPVGMSLDELVSIKSKLETEWRSTLWGHKECDLGVLTNVDSPDLTERLSPIGVKSSKKWVSYVLKTYLPEESERIVLSRNSHRVK